MSNENSNPPRQPDYIDQLMAQANANKTSTEKYLKLDGMNSMKLLNEYLEEINDDAAKPFPCPWLRVLPIDLRTSTQGLVEVQKAGTLYCTGRNGPCTIKGRVMPYGPGKSGEKRLCFECEFNRSQFIVVPDGFLSMPDPNRIYDKPKDWTT
jgi:hypothetical protein